MSRNAESHFSQVPLLKKPRARFTMPHSHVTTINEGDLVPIYAEEILPGDTAQIDVRGLIRESTPLWPVMDNAYIDIYFFWCPNRILWEHWRELQGENRSSYWAQTTTYSTPQTTPPEDEWTITSPTNTDLTIPQYGWKDGTIADYIGIPTGVHNFSVSSLYFRAYGMIWNEFFRDENLQQPQNVPITDATVAGANNDGSDSSTMLNQAIQGGYPLKAARFHDYFSSCLPQPQKGSAVNLNDAGSVPVKTKWPSFEQSELNTNPMSFDTTAWGNSPRGWNFNARPTTSGKQYGSISNIMYDGSDKPRVWAIPAYSDSTEPSGTLAGFLVPNNLYADIGAISINDLRQAIVIQQILELDARSGTRYRELINGRWGVTVPDGRVQIPEYLGGFRQALQTYQIVQTSSTDSTSPQGNTGAFSKTGFNRSCFTKSFPEHGILMGLAVIRVDHSYQQGLNRKFSRKTRFDYYEPLLANIGEQAVLNKEIYLSGNSNGQDEEVFGYQEAWADYRYRINRISGAIRSNAIEGSLDSWVYTDWYDDLPTLSSSWIPEGKENIDRTLAVTSDLAHQFICDFYFDEKWTRELPVYSIPGLTRI